jgi:hypothetical protein
LGSPEDSDCNSILNEFNLLASLNLLETIFSPLVKRPKPVIVQQMCLNRRWWKGSGGGWCSWFGFPADSGTPADYGLISILSAERACG